MIRARRGFGIISADVPANPCGTKWAWSIPTCWQWPKSLIYGDHYPAPPQPPVMRSTLPDGSAIPQAPASGEGAAATIDALIGQHAVDTAAADLAFFAGVNADVNAPSGIPWWVWLAGGLGVFALVAVAGGSPRRYGR